MEMKAIVVIEMPKDCEECPLYSEDDYGYGCGYGTNESRRRTNVDNKIPSWCPLKPMPEPRNETIGDETPDAEAHGWNLCIEELEK